MKAVDDVKKYVYDSNLLVEEIKKFPHTYKTLLTSSCYKDGTLQFIARRKLNILHKDGIIHKTTIPGTRFGVVLFYVIKKPYQIIIEETRMGVTINCFFNYKKLSKFYIEVEKYYILDECEWTEKNEKKVFFIGNLLKWI